MSLWQEMDYNQLDMSDEDMFEPEKEFEYNDEKEVINELNKSRDVRYL